MNQECSVGKRTFIEQLKDETIGVVGEMSCAKHMGIYFEPGVDVFHQSPDVSSVDVRTVDSFSKCLIVRDNDHDDRNVVLVVVNGDDVELVGWKGVAESKVDKYLRNPNGTRKSWFVPISDLNKMEDMMAQYEKNPDEIGTLWLKTNMDGTPKLTKGGKPYFSGVIAGVGKCLAFPKKLPNGKQLITILREKERPQENAPAPQPAATPDMFGEGAPF